MTPEQEYLKIIRETPLSDGEVAYVKRAFELGKMVGQAQVLNELLVGLREDDTFRPVEKSKVIIAK